MITDNKAACVAIGNFDGIHIGHDVLIKKMLQISNYNNEKSIIVTFEFVDNKLKKSNSNLKYINNSYTKLNMLRSYGVNCVEDIELDATTSKYTPEEFIQNILVSKLNAKNIVVGYNFRFGYKACGDVNTLRKYGHIYGYEVEEIPPVKYNGIVVSSTLIRDLIVDGKIKEANSLLVQNYTVSCEDIEFDWNKNKGFVNNKKGIIIPADGIYKVEMGSNLNRVGVCNTEDGAVISFESRIEPHENIEFLHQIIK